MKKKILIVMNTLKTGGISSAVVNLLNEISKQDKYDITLFLFHKGGSLLTDLPKNINIIEANRYLQILGMNQYETKQKSVYLAIVRLIMGGITKLFSDTIPYSILFKTQEKLSNYDVAISFMQSASKNSLYGGCNEFVIQRVNASHKYTFVHCDYVTFRLNNKHSHNIYKKFEKIAIVSESCKKIFDKAEPLFIKKIYVVKNCYNYPSIIQKANDYPVIYDNNIINIVTIARLGKEKGHLRALEVFNIFNRKGYNFCWHIIGDGPEKEKIVSKIIEFDLDRKVKLYGNQENPFKYLINADLLLVPSYHEAAPMVFEEAKTLNIPILSTNTASAIELVENNGCGIVCDNMDEGIYTALEKVLNNKKLLKDIKENIKHSHKKNNDEAISQFINLIEA